MSGHAGISFAKLSAATSASGNAAHSELRGMMSRPREDSDWDDSDMEQDDEPILDDEPNLDDKKTPFSAFSRPDWTPAQPETLQAAPMISQYGIGAKLLMQMGYQQGKGLGSKGDGIAEPIATKLRPQGLGVGGIREKAREADSDDHTIAFSKPTYDLYAVIETLEGYNVTVPRKYKELADSRLADPVQVEQAYTKLLTMSTQLVVLDQRIRTLKLDLAQNESSIEADTEERKRCAELLALVGDVPTSVEDATDVLQKLALQNNVDVGKVFVAVAHSHALELFAASDVQILAEWAVLYRSLQNTLDELSPWDAMIYLLVQKELAQTSAINEKRERLRFWLDSPVVINTPRFEETILEETLLPQLTKLIDGWVMEEGFETEILENVSEFSWTPPMYDRIIRVLTQKYEAKFGEIGIWLDVQKSATPRSVYDEFKRVLDDYVNTALVLIDQHWQAESVRLGSVLRDGLLSALHSDTFWETERDQQLLFILCDFALSYNFLSLSQLEAVLQFRVLNPIFYRFQAMLADKKRAKEWFYEWQSRFLSLSEQFPETKPVLLWYTNALLSAAELEPKLPSYVGNTLPDNLEEILLEATEDGSVYGLAEWQLSATFRDVVESMCQENGILFRATGATNANMHPLYELQLPSGKIYKCFIADDVLWVESGSTAEAVDVALFLA